MYGDLGDNVLHIGGEAIPLQKGSCSLAGLKSCCTVLDTNASLPSHSECVAVEDAELQTGHNYSQLWTCFLNHPDKWLWEGDNGHVHVASGYKDSWTFSTCTHCLSACVHICLVHIYHM